MDIKQFIGVLRAHWVLILASVALFTAAAGVYAWTREPVYAAHTQLFVSASSASDLSPDQVYQGDLAAQSRAESYARIIPSPPVANAVIDTLDLDMSTQAVQQAITATVPAGTVLIDITVEDESPQLAKKIAKSLAVDIPEFVDTLEEPATPGEPATAEASPVDISVVSRPTVPTSPESPGKGVYLAVGAVVGFLIGVGAAVLRELLDRRIRDDDAAEAIAGAPVLGHVPRDPGAKVRPVVVVDDPDSPPAEAYRQLRTNLRVATIDSDRRSLLVTSAVPGEGKRLLTANLGFAFAQAGHHVVLVDADLRRPRLGPLLGLEPTLGLSDLLAGDMTEEEMHHERQLPLEVLPSGAPRRNPSELLESARFADLLDRLTQRADIVILDSPALLPVSDGAIMARSTAAILLVARISSTSAEELDMAAEALRAVGKRPVGAVLNGLPARTGRAYAYAPSGAAGEEAPAQPVWEY